MGEEEFWFGDARAKKYEGNSVAKEGCVSISKEIKNLRNFQRDKKLGDDMKNCLEVSLLVYILTKLRVRCCYS